MLAALRSLCFANLSECHEMILRSLDEITKYHLDCLEDFRNVELAAEFEPSFLKTSGSVGIMRDAIAMLSNEFYRKQCMVHIFLDSVEDELIEKNGSRSYSDGAKGDIGVYGEWEDLSRKHVVQRCCVMWPVGYLRMYKQHGVEWRDKKWIHNRVHHKKIRTVPISLVYFVIHRNIK